MIRRIIKNETYARLHIVSITGKNALYPYRRCIENRNSDTCTIPVIKPLRSRGYYNIYTEKLTRDANITFVTKYLDSYCNSNDEIHAFHRKVVLEKEIKLKEFKF